MPELIETLRAIQKKEHDARKFQASLKGIDIDEYVDDREGSTSFEDVKLRAAGINATSSDVVSLQGNFAAQAGFGIGAGLGYYRE